MLGKSWVMPSETEQMPVFGLPVHLLDDYSHWLGERLYQGISSHVVTLNAEMTMLAQRDTDLAAIIQQAELVVPDGSGIIFYLWLQGQQGRRCPGIELAESLLHKAGKLGESCSVFFYGGAPDIAALAATLWQQKLPGLKISGISHGYLSPKAEQELKLILKNQQPRLILVGLGVPRQELWIAQNRHLCPQATWIGVGGSFDIWAGIKNRAPVWLRNNHLEWLYRLYQEPWRWQRMMVLPHFALKAIAQLFT